MPQNANAPFLGNSRERSVMYRRYLESWRRWAGIDMEAARKYAANTPLSIRPTSDQFLAEPERWATLDYRTIDSPNVAGKI